MKQRSTKYKAAAKKVEAGKLYPLAEAIDLAKQTSYTTFDGSLEMHIRLGIDPKKSDQSVRSTVVLPHASGKPKRIVVFTEKFQDAAKEAGADLIGGAELIQEIKTNGKLDFEVAIASPEMMPKLAAIAKVLGPRGLMPSPKNETVTADIPKTLGEMRRGKVAFKNDTTGNIHQAIGKLSLDTGSLLQNAEAFLEAVRKAKPSTAKGVFIKSLTVTSTMGPGIPASV